MPSAKGTFSIQFQPAAEQQNFVPDTSQTFFDKQWSGDLQGQSQGHMLAFRQVAYVALEAFTGTVQGRSGSFVFTQVGDSAAGHSRLLYRVAEGSGSGELVGIRGELKMEMVDKVHHYELNYELPEGG